MLADLQMITVFGHFKYPNFKKKKITSLPIEIKQTVYMLFIYYLFYVVCL